MITSTTIVLYNSTEKIMLMEVKPNIRCEIPEMVSIFVGDLNQFYLTFPEYKTSEE